MTPYYYRKVLLLLKNFHFSPLYKFFEKNFENFFKLKKIKNGLKIIFFWKVKALCYSNVGSIFHIYFLKIEKCNFLIFFFFLRTLSTKMVRQGPQMVRLVQFFFLRLTVIDKLEFTAYSQLRHPFLSYRNLPISVAYGIFTPPPILFRVNRVCHEI